VGKGTAPEGKQPDATLLLKDEDFAKLLSGEVPAQRLFMSGGMKVRGDIMKATKAEVSIYSYSYLCGNKGGTLIYDIFC